MSARRAAVATLLCALLVACAGATPAVSLKALGLPVGGKALADVTISTSPDGGIYQNPDPMTVLMVRRASGNELIERGGPGAKGWDALKRYGDFTFVGIAVHNKGAAGSDPQLNAMQIAADYAPKGTASGPLSHFYHPMFPLALLSLEFERPELHAPCRSRADAARRARLPAHQLDAEHRLGRVRRLCDTRPLRRRPSRHTEELALDAVHATAACMTPPTSPAWSVHLGTAGCTCIRFTCDRAGAGDPWPLSRVVTELVRGGASMAERPRALGSGRGIPLVQSQVLSWQGTTLELEAHHLRDGGSDEMSVTLPAWDELAAVVSREDDVWEMIDLTAAAIAPRFGIIGDGESIGSSLCETAAGIRALMRRHTGVLVHAYSSALANADASPYRELPCSGMVALIR